MSSSSKDNISSPEELTAESGNRGSSLEDPFTVVSYSKKKATSLCTRTSIDTSKGARKDTAPPLRQPTSSIRTRAATAFNKEHDNGDQAVNMSKFLLLQEQVFPILSYLVRPMILTMHL